jgi:hypothetical protein
LGNTWRGGVYYGEYDSGAGNRYMVLYDETAPFTINWWSANGAPTPAVNSNVDGALNTATLVTANAAAYTIANTASNLSANGYTDWFQPSWSELDFMVRAANAVIPSQPSTLLQPGTFPTNNEYWTSTVFDDGARKVQVVAWNANGNVGAVGTDARVFANTHPADLADAARQVIVRSETQGT